MDEIAANTNSTLCGLRAPFSYISFNSGSLGLHPRPAIHTVPAAATSTAPLLPGRLFAAHRSVQRITAPHCLADQTKRRLERSPNHAASLAHPLSHDWEPQATKSKQSPSQTPLNFAGFLPPTRSEFSPQLICLALNAAIGDAD